MTDAEIWMVDLDGTGSMHSAGKGDPGAVGYTQTDTLPTWQPIETAPKDGTFVILARLYELDGEPMSVVTFGHWTDGYDDGPDEMGMNSGWEDHHYSEFDPGRDFGNPSYMREPRQPTHWMPLPPAPKGPTHE